MKSLLTLIIVAVVSSSVYADDKLTAFITVNELAAKPASNTGPVALVGIVGVVTPGKGVIVVDKKEYDDCGLMCLRESGTKRIPVEWKGDAPKLETLVRVDGTLSNSEKGLTLAATEIKKP